MIFFYFKEWFYLNENAFEDQSLAILNQDQHLLDLIKPQCPEPKYLPIIAYFYKQSNNLKSLIQNINKYKEFVDKKKLPMIQITRKGALLNNQQIDYIRFTEIIHAAEASKVVKVSNLNTASFGLNPIFSIKDKIDIYKAKDEHDCIILGKGSSFCISNPVPGLNMWKTYRNAYESTFYFVFEKTRQANDPLKIVVVDARNRGQYELTDESNNTGTIAEFDGPEQYFEYLKSTYGINSKSIFISDPLTTQERIDNLAVEDEIVTLSGFKKLTSTQKEKYIGNGYLLTNEQFDFVFNNNMTNLILKYINTGIKLNVYQLSKIFKNASYKKSYLRQRSIAQEYLDKPDISRFEYLSLDDQSKSKIDLNKIDKKAWLLDAAEMGDEKYFTENKNEMLNASLPFNVIVNAYKKAAISNNINIAIMIDELMVKVKPKSNIAIAHAIKDIFEYIAEHGNYEILKHFVEKYFPKKQDNYRHISSGVGNSSFSLSLRDAINSISKRDKKDMLQFVIDNFNITNFELTQGLFAASEYNSLNVLEILLSHPLSKEIDESKNQAVANAAKNGNIKIAKIILNKINPNKIRILTILMPAIRNNQYHFLEFIFNDMKDLVEKQLNHANNYLKILEESISAGNLPIFKLILSNIPDDAIRQIYFYLLDYANDNKTRISDELFDFIKKITFSYFYDLAKKTATNEEIDKKSDDEIKRLFNIFRDKYGIEDFRELKSIAKDHNLMNIYRVLSKSPFLYYEQ